MANGQIGSNRVYIKGRTISGFRYSHEVYGERFSMEDIGICRNSGYMDVIPLIIPERLAVGRPYGKADYIPCVAWGWNAKLAARLKVGMAVDIQGRIQSREYVKWLSEGGAEMRVAYEVSASTLQLKGSIGETPVGAMVCTDAWNLDYKGRSGSGNQAVLPGTEPYRP